MPDTQQSSNENPRRLMVYAHYNPDCTVSEHVLYTLEESFKAGVETLFVTTSPITSKNDRKKLSAHVLGILQVDNIGYDFYAWKIGIDSRKEILHKYDRLILMNSSVIGPLFNYSTFLNHLDGIGKDLVGITSSNEICYHIQSYFLYFSRDLFLSEHFEEYWKKFVPVADRQQTIFLYDLGYSIGAYWESTDCNNPTMKYPHLLLEKKVPFIKIQLLRDNPANIDLSDIRELLKNIYDIPVVFKCGLN